MMDETSPMNWLKRGWLGFNPVKSMIPLSKILKS
jgi:hypothetical protein